MSRITFRTFDRAVDLRGSERAYLGLLVDGIGSGLMPDWRDTIDLIEPASVRPALMERPQDVGVALRVNFRDLTLRVGEQKVEPFVVYLNTAIALGNDPVVLGAYIHGTCETHGWFEAEDGPWAAAIIWRGLKDGIYRREQGWEDVRSLLIGAKSPVVMSFSVTNGFPDVDLVTRSGLGPEPEYDVEYWWEHMTERDRWALSMQALRENGGGPRIHAGMFRELFEPQFTALDLRRK